MAAPPQTAKTRRPETDEDAPRLEDRRERAPAPRPQVRAPRPERPLPTTRGETDALAPKKREPRVEKKQPKPHSSFHFGREFELPDTDLLSTPKQRTNQTDAQTLHQMSRQLEELDRGLRIVNETVAHQARFHLSVTPVLPAADQRAACVLGSERFDEFAAQVGRRVRLGTSLMQETMDRLSTPKREAKSSGLRNEAQKSCSLSLEPDLRTSNPVGIEVEHSTAVREGGSLFNFPGKAGLPLH